MLKTQGYNRIAFDDGKVVEYDSITCGHCNLIVLVKPGTGSTTYLVKTLHVDPFTRKSTIVTKEEAGAFCRVCMRAVCLKCHAHGECTPLMRRIEQMEARGRFIKAVFG